MGGGSVDIAPGGRKCEDGKMNVISEKKSDFSQAENFEILSQMKLGNSINSSDFSAVHNSCLGWSLLLLTQKPKTPARPLLVYDSNGQF